MGMVVRTNTMAMNANRQLGVNNSQVAKSLEKLSSGFRINRAGDDASGLAISEKMKAQIKGLEQASANSQDGISLVQTAEGALTEVHNMLNRMVELATKSANGTIQNAVDRDAIQAEVDSLTTEITRISQSTNFNGINLLNGTLGGYAGTQADTTSGIAANSIAISGGNLDASTVFTLTTTATGNVTVGATGSDFGTGVSFEGLTTANTGTSYTLRAIVADGTANNIAEKWEGVTISFTTAGTKAAGNSTYTTSGAAKGLTLQVGDTADSFNKVTVNVDDLSASGLGINGIRVDTQTAAGNSIQTIKTAINTVSTNRANMGALQNRLEYTINNLDTTAENMTSANSRIRDTDMAKEMMQYTKMNILTQAAQAMLAQANQQPQQILQLLQ